MHPNSKLFKSNNGYQSKKLSKNPSQAQSCVSIPSSSVPTEHQPQYQNPFTPTVTRSQLSQLSMPQNQFQNPFVHQHQHTSQPPIVCGPNGAVLQRSKATVGGKVQRKNNQPKQVEKKGKNSKPTWRV